LKVLQINASYKPAYLYGGPTMSVSKLCEQLVKTGVKVNVFTTTANGPAELPVLKNKCINVDGADVIYFKRITKDHSHFSPALLMKLWKDVKKYDLVHIHAWWNLVSILSAFIAIVRKVPVLVSPRGTLSSYSFNNKNSPLKKTFHNLLGKRLLDRSYIHATSTAEQKALSEIIQPKKIFNISNFVKLPEHARSEKLPDGPVLKLLFLSRIEEKKGLDILLYALPLINIPYRLTIAGDGDKSYIDELKDIALNNLTSSNISWIGFQNEAKFDVLRDHHLLILPSYNENFGNVVIESLSVGTAVLISEYVGLADYVNENNFGWLCGTDVTSISRNINDISINKQDDLVRIRKNAPSKIYEDFNEDKLVQKYIEKYTQIINHDSI
jgi:glycosyltransferase involved in cell wall biosynthesis